MSASLPCEILRDTVVRTGLCTRCGTCAGVCPGGNVEMRDPTGACLPQFGARCTACGLCLESCPGARVDFVPLEERLFGAAASNRLLGHVTGAYVAHATDAGVRNNGSSGGVVTALLIDLLQRKEVAGAVCYAPHESEPWRGWGRIVRDEEGIRAAAQSRYHLSPMNTALRDLHGQEGTYAYVGLPCQVHGLRKLSGAREWGRVSIEPVIGIYCGNNLYYEATRIVLRKLGVSNLADVSSLRYRDGAWPGSLTVKTAGGARMSIPKLEFNQAIPFYVNRRCLFCIDLCNELADVSVGDGWVKEGTAQGGWSVVLTRSRRGEEIVRRAGSSGSIHLEAIDLHEAQRMHAHALDLKKTGSFLRLSLWPRWGISVPGYDRSPPAVGACRRLAELFVSMQFLVCSSRGGRFLFRLLPLRPVGSFFVWLRAAWMRISRR